MKRDDVIAFLARCVSHKLMTEPQAVDALRSFDAGTFPLKELPIPPEQFITGLTRAQVDEALA
jgi:hypothetical protein